MVNLRSPVQRGIKSGYRIVCTRCQTRRKDKRAANRTYRRVFKQQLHSGIEALSEFQPSGSCFLTSWDVS